MKFDFVTKILSFNPSDLLSESLRRRKLLKNPDVIKMLEVAHLYGGLEARANNLGSSCASDYTFEKVITELGTP